MAEEVLRLGVDPRGAQRGFRAFDSAATRSTVSAQSMAGAVGAIGGAMVAFAAARQAGAAIRAAIEWETALIGVAKTVDATTAEIDALGGALREMSTQIPTTAVELAGIAEAAGQLGIQTSNILAFTRVMADLGVTTNLSSTEAATSFARLANVMGTSQDRFDEMGSIVVDLGNNLATTEREIVEFGQRLAGAGRIAGLSEANVLAIGGALSSVGVEAEAGGTAVQKAILGINTAVSQGGPSLAAFARVAGVSAEEFAAAWREDAGGAFTAFIEGLGRQGDAAATTLDQLGLGGARSARSFLSLANAGSLLDDAMTRANIAQAENNALTAEAERFYESSANQLQILRNEVDEVMRSFGARALPVFVGSLRTLIDVVPAAGNLLISLTAVAGAAGAALAFSQLAVAVQSGAAAMVAISTAVSGATAVMTGLSVLLTGPAGIVAALAALGVAVATSRTQLRDLNEEVRQTEVTITGAAAAMGELGREAIRASLENLTAAFERQRQVVAGLRADLEAAPTGGLGIAGARVQADLMAATRELERLEALLTAAAQRWTEFGIEAEEAVSGIAAGSGGASFVAPLISDMERAVALVPRLRDAIGELEFERSLAGSDDELQQINADIAELERQLTLLEGIGAPELFDALGRAPAQLDAATRSAANLREAIDSMTPPDLRIPETIEPIEREGVRAAEVFRDEWLSVISQVGGALGGIGSQIANIVSAFAFGGRNAGIATSIGAFGGFFAGGGVLQPGQFGVVGERGPELVSAGATPLRITPGAPPGSQISINVDARGSSDPAATRVAVQEAIAAAAPSLIAAARGQTIETLRRPRFA